MDKSRITVTEVIFLLIGILLIFALARIAAGQSQAPGAETRKAHAQVQQPLYRDYRGVRLGMTATEVRAKLGEPALKSDEQDFFVISVSETAQIAYTALKVTTISTDYAGGVGAPDYKNVVGEGMLLQRPDGTTFKMVMYDAERFWVTYSKSATASPIVTVTIGAFK
jgi:hypothetical protein